MIQGLGICPITQGTWVWSLLGELRSHTPQLLNPHGTTKRQLEGPEEINSFFKWGEGRGSHYLNKLEKPEWYYGFLSWNKHDIGYLDNKHNNNWQNCLLLLSLLQWQPTPVLLPGKSHGQRSLVGCSPWGLEELDTTERLHFHFALSCIGEGNGNPLQCSRLENPRDGGAWWAAVYGVTQVGHDRSDLAAAAALSLLMTVYISYLWSVKWLIQGRY